MDADLLLYVLAGWLGIAAVSFGIRIAIERWFWRNKQ
jgi:hypothetical protein